jgi:hypothetical protein
MLIKNIIANMRYFTFQRVPLYAHYIQISNPFCLYLYIGDLIRNNYNVAVDDKIQSRMKKLYCKERV